MSLSVFGAARSRLRVLCIGAHSDDIEIGCLGTILRLRAEKRLLALTWLVLSGDAPRRAEAQRSLGRLRAPGLSVEMVNGDLPDSHFPAEYRRGKEIFAQLARRLDPDVVFTHRLEDRHQDHRLAAEMTWQSFRDHLVLEYEIPKYEGDLGQPNVFVELPQSVAMRKVRHLMRHFGSQRSKSWFSPETFTALMRLRGVECRARSAYAEAFTARKIRV